MKLISTDMVLFYGYVRDDDGCKRILYPETVKSVTHAIASLEFFRKILALSK